MRADSSARYGSLQVALHWLMLALLVAVYACIELRELYPRGSEIRLALKTWHFMLGLSVLILVGVRLVVRAFGLVPPISPRPPPWQLRVAHGAELAIYAFMIAMPLLGWLILSGEGEPVPFFGLQFPALISPNKELAMQVEEIHETVGNIGYFLIGVHAAAALAHHYIRRDDTLLRMLPVSLARLLLPSNLRDRQ